MIPPFKKFTLMEDSPTTASDSAANPYEGWVKKYTRRVNGKQQYYVAFEDFEGLVKKEAALQSEVAALKTELDIKNLTIQRYAKGILKVRDELARGDNEEAYHQLRLTVDPHTRKLNHWEKEEEITAALSASQNNNVRE